MADPRPLRRDQLAKFLPDEETIRRFERLFDQVGNTTPQNVGNAEIDANNALSLANLSLDEIQSLKDYLDNNIVNHDDGTENDYIDFNLAPYSEKERRLSWDNEFLTFSAGLINGKQLKIGQDVLYCVKNTSGATINKGQSVMATGVVGASAKIEAGLAVADGTIDAMYMLGIASHDILKNEFGYITQFGKIKGFNTTGSAYGETWADGDVLHFNPSVAGGLTKINPIAPNLNLPIAIVLNASAGSGSILVRMNNGNYLKDLHDVYVNSLSDSQILKYEGNKWINKPFYLPAITYTPASGATVTMDLKQSTEHRVQMPASNVTLALSNESFGNRFVISITQDSIGLRTVTWFGTIKWAGGVAPTLTTTGNKRDTFEFIRTGLNAYDGFILGQNI
jgi:hypothetical protein